LRDLDEYGRNGKRHEVDVVEQTKRNEISIIGKSKKNRAGIIQEAKNRSRHGRKNGDGYGSVQKRQKR
jgi:hypothetical protein